MARLHPDTERARVVFASSAEEQFYEQARATLGDAWRVYYSCTLSSFEGDEGIRDNEIDFICYHPRLGVIVVEVKGGRIRRDGQTGVFSSVNRHGETFQIKDPFQQALSFKSRFLRFLKRHNIKVPVSHAVCFPGASEDEFPVAAGMAPEIILGRGRLKDLDQALRALVEKTQPEQYLRFDDVAGELDRILIGSTFTTRLYLRDYIDGHEHRVRDVATIQETLITPIASTRRLGVEGEAGTGKTMLAIMLAKRFRDQGRSVLLMTSNALLNLLLQRDLGEGIEVLTYAEIAASFGVNLLIPPDDYAGAKEDWIQYEAPDRLKKAVGLSPKRYDVLISDEGQDVQPFWWEAFESLLKASDEDSRFYIFFDSSQGVFGTGNEADSFVAAEVLPIKPPYFPLVHNYRTTREIASFSRAFRTGRHVLHSHAGRLGYVPELITYKDADDARQMLAKLTRKLTREEGILNEEITLISARNPAAKESILYQTDEIAKVKLHRLHAGQKKTWREARPPKDAMGLATIAGFKGMETSVGILINVSEYNLPADNPLMASLIYVACTRAKHMLYVFVQEQDPKRVVFEKALETIKTTGALVLEGSRSDHEFAGRVTHYNPERVGFLTVDDPSFQQPSVMFFPNDVARSDLGEVKVGMKVKFRPRQEGHVTIASDLQVIKGA